MTTAPVLARMDLVALLDDIAALAVEAGHATLPFYEGDHGATAKSDGSPVTLADHAAEAVILPGLARLTPAIPAVSEEAAERGEIPAVAARQPFWLVDPLDGTKEFIKRNGEFTVNIALVDKGQPVLGVVYAPASGELFAGSLAPKPLAWRQRAGGERETITCRPQPRAGVTVVSSRSHANDEALAAYLKAYSVAETLACGSSVKFCRIAEGVADLYPRFGPTCEWDTAAGHAVLLAAGGGMTTPEGDPFRYGKAGFRNGPFIAHGK
ncbi:MULTISPECIES: 3'(2'),5'-bisphosphate nucleotidase CysQ [Nitrospirillum]|nr:3'(2'),5'-bisphosphate nucleotidase CysQ [Nitrospirillum amazonense]TWB42807.1 3'(2'),5'-bisphosphate nucleotidase [Nitrospirillum amazonense]TWB77543.1 3'(2'),5'-bisphosphate nucleotidase [Nitrospirillum amazonense]